MTILKQLYLFCLWGMMSLFISLITSLSVMAAPPLIPPHTPQALTIKPQSLLVSSDNVSAYKLAGTYWLPDYLKSNLGTSSSSDNGGGDTSKNNQCSTYGFQAPSAVNLSLYACDTVKPRPGLSCYKNCKCLSKYQYTDTNCKASEGKKAAGLSCEGKSESCVCLPSVTVGSGEVCTLYCGGSCVKKQCKPTVTAGTGEVCSETCASTGACTAKRCKSAVSVGSGEVCTENCANGGTCTAKRCKPTVSVGTGEVCSETCASTGACTAKRCKSSQSVGAGSYCSERCASNNSICTGSSCNSTSGYQYCSCGGYGGSVNSCGTTYYKYCSACCSPSCSSDWGCSCGTYTVSDGCGGSCTKCSSCCSHSSHVTCQYGCASTCPCDGSCSSCKSGNDCKSGTWSEHVSKIGWCDCNGTCQGQGPKYHWCGDLTYCTTYSGSKKQVSGNWWIIGGPYADESECRSKMSGSCY